MTITGKTNGLYDVKPTPYGYTSSHPSVVRNPIKILKTPLLKMNLVDDGATKALQGRELPPEVMAIIGNYVGLPTKVTYSHFNRKPGSFRQLMKNHPKPKNHTKRNTKNRI
jgi:hypothetical protein